MEKKPVKRKNADIERADCTQEIDVFNPFQIPNPFIAFRYSYREISSVGGKTYLRAEEKSFVHGKFTSEEFEAVAPENLYLNMVAEMQKMFMGQMSSLMNMFSGFFPKSKED